MRRVLKIVGLIVLFGVTFAAGFVRLPYYAVEPGPAREVDPLISVQDHPRYASAGKLIMTTVRWYQLTAVQAVRAWIDSAQRVVPEEELYPPGEDPTTERQRATSQMDTSKIDATSVVLSELAGYPKQHAKGALIESTIEGCPAFQRLFAGDLILSIEGTDIRSAPQASRVIDRVPVDEPLSFSVEAAGETHDLELTRARCDPRVDEPILGIHLVQPFPFPVEISSGDVGGPSAGLMFALGLYDTLTPGDLTAGQTIAGTGAIDLQGRVFPIGGIRDKLVEAERVGADVFLVPSANMAELDGADTGDVRLVSVRSFDQALEELEASGGALNTSPTPSKTSAPS
jgi:Lon-like protease